MSSSSRKHNQLITRMAGTKSPKAANASNKPVFSRISYLYQAATYLSSVQSRPEEHRRPSGPAHIPEQVPTSSHVLPVIQSQDAQTPCKNEKNTPKATNVAFSRQLVSHMLEVSLKSQTSLSPDLKRSICRRCHSLLVPGRSSRLKIENLSRGGRKPWADVLVVECTACTAVKRFPIGQERQRSRDKRRVSTA